MGLFFVLINVLTVLRVAHWPVSVSSDLSETNPFLFYLCRGWIHVFELKRRKCPSPDTLLDSFDWLYWVLFWCLQSLCNACGIRYKKEERRATTNTAAIEAHHLMGHHHHHHHHWGYAGQPQMAAPASGNGEFRLIEEEEEDNDDGESSSPYLSWRLNVPPPDFPVHMTWILPFPIKDLSSSSSST